MQKAPLDDISTFHVNDYSRVDASHDYIRTKIFGGKIIKKTATITVVGKIPRELILQ